MTNLQRLNLVRNLLRNWFADRAGGGAPHPQLVEACLIRNGFYCGRRFQCGDHTAVWFAEEDEIKIYAPNGALLEACAIEQANALGATAGEMQATYPLKTPAAIAVGATERPPSEEARPEEPPQRRAA